jgi:hypothetical protein
MFCRHDSDKYTDEEGVFANAYRALLRQDILP